MLGTVLMLRTERDMLAIFRGAFVVLANAAGQLCLAKTQAWRNSRTRIRRRREVHSRYSGDARQKLQLACQIRAPFPSSVFDTGVRRSQGGTTTVLPKSSVDKKKLRRAPRGERGTWEAAGATRRTFVGRGWLLCEVMMRINGGERMKKTIACGRAAPLFESLELVMESVVARCD